MNPNGLHALAGEAGLLIEWEDAAGQPKTVAPEALIGVLEGLGLPAGSEAEIAESRERLQRDAAEPTRFTTAEAGGLIEVRLHRSNDRGCLTLEDGAQSDVRLDGGSCAAQIQAPTAPGYHRLEIGDQEIIVAVAPRRARSVLDVSGGRPIWGTAAQVYAVRDERSEAFGDFGALRRLAQTAARHGADALAISPVHALFLADPSRYSPYSPSTRLFLNGLYADPSDLFESWEADPGGGALIDWPSAGASKTRRLRAHFDWFRDADQSERRADYERFRQAGGQALERHARFEALHAKLAPNGAGGWPEWPTALQDPESSAVEAFAHAHAEEVAFHMFVQWLAESSLAAAQKAALEAGMSVGLIADMAVGTDAGGSHAWSSRDEILTRLNVGAPPDLFQAHGQDWGVAAFSPQALRRTGFGAYLATLRSAMKLAGGLRIDHVMGLRRLWMVPRGGSAADGAYLAFPETDLLRLTALESQRAGAIVVGEDLGTVPEGFRDTLHDAGVLGMSVLWFERQAQAFLDPERWPSGSAALTSTHDLPTIAGWWSGRDLEWRAQAAAAGSQPSPTEAAAGPSETAPDIEAALKERAADRIALWDAFQRRGVAAGPPPAAQTPKPAVDAAAAFVADAPGPLALIPLEDLLGLVEQINLPGPPGPHPNWRRRLPLTPEALFADPAVAPRLERLNKARPR